MTREAYNKAKDLILGIDELDKMIKDYEEDESSIYVWLVYNIEGKYGDSYEFKSDTATDVVYDAMAEYGDKIIESIKRRLEEKRKELADL